MIALERHSVSFDNLYCCFWGKNLQFQAHFVKNQKKCEIFNDTTRLFLVLHQYSLNGPY